MRRSQALVVAVLFAGACGAAEGPRGVSNNPNAPTADSPTTPTNNNPTAGPNDDNDHDGVTVGQGDCDDSNPLVNPNMAELGGNGIDDDCNGKVDDTGGCDTGVVGQTTADALAKAMGLCQTKFITTSGFNGPSDVRARNTVASFGVVHPKEGQSMVMLSSGVATTDPSYTPEPGTRLGQGQATKNQFANPVLGLASPATSGCGGGSPPSMVQDYTEYAVTFQVPANASSLSFNFQFFSAEYPEYVCSQYNDRFVVILDDGTNAASNIAFDSSMNMVSVNNGFFTVCENWETPETSHCTTPVSAIAGTGYDVQDDGYNGPDDANVGGATAWLTTTAPVTAGATVKLRFIIFDEGDDKLDSAVLVDNFQWGGGGVSAPSTTVTVQ